MTLEPLYKPWGFKFSRLHYSGCFSGHIPLGCLPRPETAHLNYKLTSASEATEDCPELRDRIIFSSSLCKSLLGNTFPPVTAEILLSLLTCLVRFFTDKSLPWVYCDGYCYINLAGPQYPIIWSNRHPRCFCDGIF